MPHFTIAAIRRALSLSPKKPLAETSLVPAGVMVLLYVKLGEYHVLLNRRTDSVEDHKGEISFPGGRMDAGDKTLLDTALRETYEEMGVRPDDVEVLGELDDVATNSRYRVSPFVGAIPEAYNFSPSESEVAEVIEVPLAGLASGQADRDEVRIVDGAPVQFKTYVHRGHVIWGATARILQHFLKLLDAAVEQESPWTSKRV